MQTFDGQSPNQDYLGDPGSLDPKCDMLGGEEITFTRPRRIRRESLKIRFPTCICVYIQPVVTPSCPNYDELTL